MTPCSLYRSNSHNSTSSTNRGVPAEAAPHPSRTRRALSPDRDKHGLPTGPADRNEPSHRIFCAPRRLFSKRLDSFASNHPPRGDQEPASETVAPVQQYPDVRIPIEIQHGSSQDNLETGLGQASWRGIDPVKAWERRGVYCDTPHYYVTSEPSRQVSWSVSPGQRGDGDGRARRLPRTPGRRAPPPRRRNVHFALERALLTAPLESKLHLSRANCTSREQTAHLESKLHISRANCTSRRAQSRLGSARPAETDRCTAVRQASTHSVPAGTTTSAVSAAPARPAGRPARPTSRRDGRR